MKYIFLVTTCTLLYACSGDNTNHTNTSNTDTTTIDSTRQHQHDEVDEEIIEGSFDALNR